MSLAQDNSKKALKHLALAADLSGPAPAPYRVAIRTAFRNGLKDELKAWCRRYLKEEFGGLRTYDYNNRFNETGVRRIALRVHLRDGQVRYFGHRGFSLGKNREYEFPFQEPLKIDQMAIELGVVPGILADIQSVTVRTASGKKTIDAGHFSIFPKNGFSLEQGSLSTSHDGETLALEFPKLKFNDVYSLSIRIKTGRVGIASASVCGGAPAP